MVAEPPVTGVLVELRRIVGVVEVILAAAAPAEKTWKSCRLL
jgi:hypothetical protein